MILDGENWVASIRIQTSKQHIGQNSKTNIRNTGKFPNIIAS